MHGHAMLTLLLRTGMRLGEALALNWADINFEKRIATVSKSWDYKHKKMGQTKTGKTRKVDLTPYSVEVLKKLREETGDFDAEPIFVTNEGQRWSDYTVRKQHKQVRLREDVGVHDLRHSYASVRVAKGHNIVDVSKQLGHAKLSTTVDKYIHWQEGEYKHQVDELDTLHLTHPIRTRDPESPVVIH